MAMREFRMPDVGEGLTEADILTWYVKPGDPVTDGQVVCEIETAKAVVELPVPFEGVVREILFPERATVPVGAVIISVDASGGDAVEPAPEPARQPVLVGYGVSDSPVVRRPRKPSAGGRPSAGPGGVARGTGPRPLAKPPVRKLARDLGVDLSVVRPSGGGSTITREDVHAASVLDLGSRAASVAVGEPAVGPTPTVSPDPRETRVPVKGVRKATAAAMVGSAFTAPHVTEFVTVDVTRTVKLVEDLRSDADMAGLRVGPLLVVAKAVLVAIKRHPEINSAWDEGTDGQAGIVRKHFVNLGVAAATPRGLIVPNIKDAHTRTLPELAAALGELVGTARAGGTSPAAMRDGTFTVTNIGVFGVDTGTPILNPGESAILAVGAIKARPWVHKGKVRPRQVMSLALSFDHRVIDGELGSRFLADVAAVLENPKRLITWA
ncbi:dihydrolipoamide acetyltransferase family protein [Streptomyces sp. NPDC048301]|uniref:dihydrolipoamide acetyltransferase family protein n=1 Tax=Streptomyces sp. NPDC048301 TaxID=3155631 RepID=UPI00343755A0